MNDLKTLSHTTWNCKYHLVFASKYRRKAFYGERVRFFWEGGAYKKSGMRGLFFCAGCEGIRAAAKYGF